MFTERRFLLISKRPPCSRVLGRKSIFTISRRACGRLFLNSKAEIFTHSTLNPFVKIDLMWGCHLWGRALCDFLKVSGVVCVCVRERESVCVCYFGNNDSRSFCTPGWSVLFFSTASARTQYNGACQPSLLRSASALDAHWQISDRISHLHLHLSSLISTFPISYISVISDTSFRLEHTLKIHLGGSNKILKMSVSFAFWTWGQHASASTPLLNLPNSLTNKQWTLNSGMNSK